jgi:DnaJ-class molecular chaperone
MKDPYVVLGVGRDASDETIKKAYRRLAKKLHPDLHPGNRATEQQFKEVTAAYDLLSDPVKRARFDRGEIDAAGSERGFQGARAGAGARAYQRAGAGAGAGSFSFDEIIAEILGRGRRESEERLGDQSQALRLPFLDAALGGKRRLTTADGRNIDITIPAGIDGGQSLRLKGQGPRAPRGVAPGDLYLEIEVDPHPFFQRKEYDIHVELPVTLTEAVLGATVKVPTIHGAVALKVPRGSNSGATLRLKGKGIAAAGKSGDQYVKLRVVLPDPPDAELTSFIERWGAKHPYDVRGKLG